MPAAASIWAMDALFGFVARNDAEWHRRELLGRSWRRDWAMRQFRSKNAFLGDRKEFCGLDALGAPHYDDLGDTEYREDEKTCAKIK